MIKNDKIEGITLVSLAITVIVLVILVSVGTYSGINVMQSAKLTAFTTELKIMQTQVNDIYENYDGQKQYGEVIEGVHKTRADEVFGELAKDPNSKIKNEEGYTYWSKDYIKNELKIEGVEQSFFVHLAKRQIVSYTGFKYEGKTYYTLQQLPSGLYNVEYQENNVAQPNFDLKVEVVGEQKWKISIVNIQYEGYIDKWQVEYRLEGETHGKLSEDLSFVVNTTGNYEVQIKNGSVISNVKIASVKIDTIESAIKLGTVFDENKTTTLLDSYGNEVKIPEGFKIATDSATDVTGGIVIEDVSHGETAGSQFVWIPIGDVYTAQEHTEETTKRIELNRYTFDENGKETAQNDKVVENYYQELATSDKGNSTAKNIEAFRTSVNTNGGYYIGRYEARVKGDKRIDETDDAELGQITVRSSDYVYNWVTQPQAAEVSQRMYNQQSYSFTSDLMNSYAWDTSIIFLQMFDNREDRTISYSIQNSLKTESLAEKGTNDLTEIAKQDKICNIWDMASNGVEWTTETSSHASECCSTRGGYYNYSGYYTSSRNLSDEVYVYDYTCFRPVLYFK